MLITVRQAATRLGVSYSTLKRWIHQGQMWTSCTKGGHHRIHENEVERLLTRQRKPSKQNHDIKNNYGGSLPISGRNQLRGIVEEIRLDGLMAQVRLRLGDQILTAVITSEAVDELRLSQGEPALAIVKSTEVMIAR
jgi:molybdopterin-binding protein